MRSPPRANPTLGCATTRPPSRSPAAGSPRRRAIGTHALPWGLGETARDVLGKLPSFVGVPYGADMRLLVNEGSTPTVLYGPGDPFLAHAPDEHVELEDVARCARVLAVWVMRTLSAGA